MNTRINPTTNGTMHLGHAYMALINERMAHSTGGKFILRCEDDQKYWLNRLTLEQMRAYGSEWEKDLDWLEIKVDKVRYESDYSNWVIDFIRDRYPDAEETGEFPEHPETPTLVDPMYPYDLWLIAKVRILDDMDDIDPMICGIDLLPRYSLYAHLSHRFGFPVVRQIFLPRLWGTDEMDNVSKTKGNYKIATFREKGVKPSEIRECLKYYCLKDPLGPWNVNNVKERPLIEANYFDPVCLADIDPDIKSP